MSISSLLSLLALVSVLTLVVAMFVGGAVYVLRLRRHGSEAVLAASRKRRELRD